MLILIKDFKYVNDGQKKITILTKILGQNFNFVDHTSKDYLLRISLNGLFGFMAL